MIHEHRFGALWRAILAAILVFSLTAGAASQAEAHGRAPVHATRHHHYHHPTRHERRHHRRHYRVTFEQFERGIAHAPINFSPGFTISIFGREIWFGSHNDDASSPVVGLGVETPFGGASVALPSDRRHAIALIKANAEAYGVPVGLALSIGHFESGFNMHMRGAAGERGAMQVLPQTARHVGVYGNLYGPAGIVAGTRYLKEALVLQSRYGLCAAISSYNQGIGRISCTSYGRTIIAMMRGESLREAAATSGFWHHRRVAWHL